MGGSVAVVGGGVGGLTTALAFVRDGWRVTVLEREPGPSSDGAALTIWPEPVRALEQLGVGDGLRARSGRQTSGALCRPDGRRLVVLGAQVQLIARADLSGLLAGALPAGVLCHGRPVDAAGVAALRAEHDLVVGADGIGSTVRAVLTGGGRSHLRRTGTVAYRGVATVPVRQGTETWGRAARFAVLPHGADRPLANWYAVLPSADARAAADDVALLRERFGDWHDPIPRVLDRIGTDGHLRHEIADVHPHLPRYTDGRSMAVLGDAAHAMTPDLGQGACQALLDGVALAAAMRGRSVAGGLAAYDRARRRPTQRLVTASHLVHRIAQARRGTRVRDALLRAVPDRPPQTPIR